MTRTSFAVDPLQFLVGPRQAIAIEQVRTYFADYTGSWFERLAANDEPHCFTEKDLVAVSTLGVEVPASTAIWLLGDGAAPVAALLEQIDTTQTLWDDHADITPAGPAWQLWDLVRSNGWPTHRGGMGPTTTSKLLAVKRTHLVPVQDSVVTNLLFGGARHTSYWAAWRERLTASDGTAVLDAADAIRAEVPAAAHLSILRILDVVLWLTGKGEGSPPDR